MATAMTNIFIGSDPESFMMQDGIIKSIHGLIPGTKKEPHFFSKNEAIQVDGTAAEWNVAPSNTFEAFSASIDACMDKIIEMLPEGFSFSTKASHVYSPEEMKAIPAEALELGCSPDFNALTGMVNTAPTPPAGLRSAGGHVAIDLPKEGNKEDMNRFVALACDVYLGLPSLFECTDTRRREIYGKASCYRPYAKFVEYRTLSNYWVFDKGYRKAVFNRAQQAAKFADEEMFDSLFGIIDMNDVAEIINTGNRDAALEMLKELRANGFEVK